jgi:hypothetical protein
LRPRRSASPVAHRRILSPSTRRKVSAPTSSPISGPNHAACTLAVYASRSRSPVYFLTISQDSLPAWRSTSSPVGFSPRVTLRNFGLLHAFLSDQACPGALDGGRNVYVAVDINALRQRSRREGRDDGGYGLGLARTSAPPLTLSARGAGPAASNVHGGRNVVRRRQHQRSPSTITITSTTASRRTRRRRLRFGLGADDHLVVLDDHREVDAR